MISFVRLFVALIVFCGGVLVLSVPLTGLAYFLSALPLIVFSVAVRNRPPYVFMPVFGASLALFAFYYIRPLVLIYNKHLYSYSESALPGDQAFALGLMLQGLFSLAFLSGLYFFLHLKGSRLRVPASYLEKGNVQSLGAGFLAVLLMISMIWVVLVVFTGAGQKLFITWTNVLLLILPVSLLIPATLGYIRANSTRSLSLWKYSLAVGVVIINIIVTLLSGSKAGVFLLILYSVFYFLLTKGNLRVHIIKIASISFICVSAIVISVMVANVAKYAYITAYSPSEIFQQTLNRSDFWLYMADRITSRLNGYDGSIAVLSAHPQGFEQFANWPYIIKSGMAQLLPGLGIEGYSLGKVVGMEFGGHSAETQHAGALGLIGVIYYMHGALVGSFVMIAIGACFGILFRMMARIASKGEAERLIAFLVLGYLQAFWISSGNFDKLIQQLFIAIFHMIFYYHLIGLFVRKSQRRAFYSMSGEA